jgi:SAM-dependent methyltransferase
MTPTSAVIDAAATSHPPAGGSDSAGEGIGATINEDKLNAFMGQIVGELGATVNAGLIVIGDRLGLYRAMAGAGSVSASQLAERTGTTERYIREWLNAQAAGGFVEHEAATDRYILPAEQDGVEEKLRAGASVADVGCGLGASTRLMATAFSNSTFVGFDYHTESIELARTKAAAAGLAERTRFEVAPAAAFPGTGYDLISMFDCLHDMGDPVGAASHVRKALAPDGTWLVVEPLAGDRIEQNLNPVSRAYYGFSTFLCTPSSLSQEVGLALGAQAGEARIRDVALAAGFTRFRRVSETPFNAVYEVRP